VRHRPGSLPGVDELARTVRDGRHRKVARSLSNVDLVRSSEEPALTEQQLVERARGRLFLDFYGDEGIRTALERYGLLASLGRRGYGDVKIETRAVDERHTLVISGRPAPDEPHVRLVDLVVRRDRMIPRFPEASSILKPAYEVLTVEWLMLANPRGTLIGSPAPGALPSGPSGASTPTFARFTAERPRLPGQEHPGLAIGWRVLALLFRVVERLQLDALVTVAEYLHNAELYARELPFLDPAHAGRLDAILDALRVREALTVAQASWAVEWGLVRDEAGAVLRWRGEAQLSVEEPSLAAWIASPAYADAAAAARKTSFTLDREAFDERWASEGPSIEGAE
jgi:hypothetical protein